MIRIHLSRLMGENKEKIVDLLRSTGLSRNTVTSLYRETSARIDLETLNAICRHYQCNVADILEYAPDVDTTATND
ncbi:helix-turn-helix domain-containing protein [Paraburkholderia terricola]|uniref:helix-turn-helix domain-containing protein n=1 Tax=Paraburkholderia terricola TaxID=169427 RepID=UPI000DEEFFB8|nr:helix-turn-helix transcriptional regulator [Paraburkholderia terricola]AXE91073.1 XRE family transcriptional regulator [Paraburkholderia terricola]